MWETDETNGYIMIPISGVVQEQGEAHQMVPRKTSEKEASEPLCVLKGHQAVPWSEGTSLQSKGTQTLKKEQY